MDMALKYATIVEWLRSLCIRHMGVVFTFCRLLVGAALLFAGFAKATDQLEFLGVLLQYRLSDGVEMRFLASAVPAAEITLGLQLLTGVAIRGAFLLAAILSAAFVAVQLSAILRGLAVPCGCYGGAEMISLWTVLRAMALLTFAVMGYLALSRPYR